MKKLLLTLVVLSAVLVVQVSWAARTSQVFNEDGDSILPQGGSTKSLGSDSVRFAGIFTVNMDVSGVFTLGGTVEIGGIDMASSSLIEVKQIGIATSTPSVELVVNSETGTSTTGIVSDAAGFGGAFIIQAPNGNCYAMTCGGIEPSGCAWATSTCTK